MKKVIIMDVDGTLTNSQKQIGARTKEALIDAQRKGALLVLASGRPTSGLVDLGKELEMDQHHGLFVAFNGSKVLDCQTNEVLFNQTMSIEEGKAVLEHMKNFNRVRPMIDKGDYMYVTDVYDCYIEFNGQSFNVYQYESRGGKYKLCEVDDLAKFVDYPLNKILTTADPQYLKANFAKMREPFIGKLNCMFTGAFYYEFTALGVDKAKALDSVLIPMGYQKSDMIAFGDGQNDATMVEYAGLGVAMANAVPELKRVADYVTEDNDHEGIAVALERFLYNKI